MLNTVRGIEKEEKSPARSPPSHSEDKLKRIVDDNRRKDFERFQPRRWREGDVYAPHDLSPEESTKFKNQRKVDIDVFDALAINPLHEYKVQWPNLVLNLGCINVDWTEFLNNVGIHELDGSYQT